MLFEQVWRVSTAVLRKRPQTAPQLSAGGRSGGAGQQLLGDGARTVTASAVHHLIRWDHPLPAALAEQEVGPGPRAPTPAGKPVDLFLIRPLRQVENTLAGLIINLKR